MTGLFKKRMSSGDNDDLEEPLSHLEKILTKTDILLKPTSATLSEHAEKLKTKKREEEGAANGINNRIGIASEISADMRISAMITDFEDDILFLQSSMPSQLSDFSSAVAWDIHLLRSECATFSCGIPGELTCQECHERFKSVQKKIIHILKKHFKPYSCEFCNEVRFGF